MIERFTRSPSRSFQKHVTFLTELWVVLQSGLQTSETLRSQLKRPTFIDFAILQTYASVEDRACFENVEFDKVHKTKIKWCWQMSEHAYELTNDKNTQNVQDFQYEKVYVREPDSDDLCTPSYFIGYDASMKLWVVSVRGTCEIADWFMNLQCLTRPFMGTHTRVHMGFADASLLLLEELKDVFTHVNTSIVFTGHSRGSAISLLTVMYIQEAMRFLHDDETKKSHIPDYLYDIASYCIENDIHVSALTFAPPLISSETDYDFMETFYVNHDIVTRLSYRSFITTLYELQELLQSFSTWERIQMFLESKERIYTKLQPLVDKVQEISFDESQVSKNTSIQYIPGEQYRAVGNSWYRVTEPSASSTKVPVLKKIPKIQFLRTSVSDHYRESLDDYIQNM